MRRSRNIFLCENLCETLRNSVVNQIFIRNRIHMKNLFQSLLLLGCFALFPSANTHACGYAWISDCASQVQLRINGTLDSFDIAACPAGFNFDGIQLGNLQSFTLANAKTITWESCQNNVSAVFLKYRVYEQGGNTGNWQSLTLQQYQQTIDGPYTTRYNSAPSNISLTNGLIPGKTYFLEVYFLAEIDTIGNDFIPETTMLKNNNGANYKMSFTYGGPAAPPILLLPHLTEPSCYGANNGNIYVSTYGNISGLFYSWSNISLNFFQQFNLAAGNYGITVTNSIGQTASATIQLGQPNALMVNFNNIQSVGCNNSPGSATVFGSGGTAPYHYLWQTGQQSETILLPSSGNWRVTMTDGHACSATGMVFIGNNGLLERSITADLCEGAIYSVGGQSFSAAGNYSFTIPGISGCDTLTHLTLNVLIPSDALTPLPDSILITCLKPQLNLCATALPGATFQWEKDGVAATTTPCLLATAGGNYTLLVNLGGCTASKTIVSSEHLLPVPAQVTGLFYPDCNGGPLPGWLVAHTTAEAPVFVWIYNGNTISTNDSCFFHITEFQGGMPVWPTLSITDKYGCENSMATFSPIIVQGTPLSVQATVIPASNGTTANGSISISVLGGNSPYTCTWDNGAITLQITGLLPGPYCVTVTDSNGCAAKRCWVVSSSSATNAPDNHGLQVFPNPASPGSWVQVKLPENLQAEILMLEIMDTQGRVLSKEQINPPVNDQISINIPDAYQQAAFIIRLVGGLHSHVATIMVQNN